MSKLYKSPTDRYADARSSAYTLLLVGGLGMTVLLFHFAGLFSLPLHNFALAIMSLLFLIFVGIGVVTLVNSSKIKVEIDSETAKIQEIKDWYLTDCIHSSVFAAMEEHFTDETPEERDLQRYEMVCNLLKGQFPEVSDTLLEKLASDFCEDE